jgi:exosortase
MINEQLLEVRRAAGMVRSDLKNFPTTRNLLFVLFVTASVGIYRTAVVNLVRLSLGKEEYSYIGVMPLLALCLLYIERKQIFQKVLQSPVQGALILLTGFLLGLVAESVPFTGETKLFVQILSLLIIWSGGFTFFYGSQTLRRAKFPLLFLFSMVPLPQFLTDKPLLVIQYGSAEIVNLLFMLSGVPFFRDGFRFSLTGLDMTVAPQCAGIHSTLALLISSLLISHFYLRSRRAKILLILAVFPIVSFTNGLRIFGLSLLTIYVSMDFFKGSLHRNGGVMFFLLGFALLVYTSRLLRPAA